MHDGEEVALPREDRLYLMANLTGGQKQRRPGALGSAPRPTQIFAMEDGELDAEEPAQEQVAEPKEEVEDDTFAERDKPLTTTQKKTIHQIHENCGHSSTA